MSSRRILFFNHTLDLAAGGAERVLLNILSLLDRARFELHLAVPDELASPPDELRQLSIPVYRLPRVPDSPGRSVGGLTRAGTSLLRLNLASASLLREVRPDLVYVNSVVALHFAGPAAILSRRRVVYHEHNLPSQRASTLWSPFFPFLARRMSRIIAITEAVRSELASLGVQPDRIETVPNGIDPGLAEPISEESLPPEVRGLGFRIGMIANFHRWKGHRTLVEAVAELRRRDPSVGAVLFGKESVPEYAAEIHGLVERLGLVDSVVFAGFRPDVQRLLPRLHCLVIASQAEPFGLVALEAMRAGVPVVASRAGGIPEVVRHEWNGLLFEPGDVPGLAAQIHRIIHDSELRERMVRMGRRTVAEEFSLTRQVGRIQQVLAEVSDGNGARR